jgi:hypothetical protein
MDETAHSSPVGTTTAWFDIDSMLPGALRTRIRAALDAAHQLQRLTDAFADEHGDVFLEYATIGKTGNAPHDVWEVLDRSSGYAALWITVLATEAMLGALLEVPPPAAITPAADVRPG